MGEDDLLFDFSNCSTDQLSVENILKRVPEVLLWRFYLNTDFIIGKPFKAPYRQDNHPSFALYFNRGNRLYFKDFGRQNGGDIFNYISLIYNISFIESLNKVNLDFDLNLRSNQPNIKVSKSSEIFKKEDIKRRMKRLTKKTDGIISKSTMIQVIPRKWVQELDLKYWEDFGISEDLLTLYNVYPLKKVFCNKRLCYMYKPSDPAYGYYFPKSKHIKVYYPFRKEYRFMGNVNNYEDVQGYYQCNVKDKSNNFLILTKSMKDVMVLRNFGIDGMAINGENHYFQEDFIRHLKKYYSTIVSLYDNDESGIKGAQSLKELYKIPPYFIPKKFDSKDISDMFKKCGRNQVEKFLNEIKEIELCDTQE